eukprot:6222253-Amphidinium_carterae.1
MWCTTIVFNRNLPSCLSSITALDMRERANLVPAASSFTSCPVTYQPAKTALHPRDPSPLTDPSSHAVLFLPHTLTPTVVCPRGECHRMEATNPSTGMPSAMWEAAYGYMLCAYTPENGDQPARPNASTSASSCYFANT